MWWTSGPEKSPFLDRPEWPERLTSRVKKNRSWSATWGFSQQQRFQPNPTNILIFFGQLMGIKLRWLLQGSPFPTDQPLPTASISFDNFYSTDPLTFDEEKTIYISQHIWKTPDHIPQRRQIILHLYDLWWFDFFALFVGLVLSPAECVSSGNSSDPSWFTEKLYHGWSLSRYPKFKQVVYR